MIGPYGRYGRVVVGPSKQHAFSACIAWWASNPDANAFLISGRAWAHPVLKKAPRWWTTWGLPSALGVLAPCYWWNTATAGCAT